METLANIGKQIGDDYYTSLQALTFNSRPIIETHTTLAQENSQYAQDIVTAVEKRIEKAIPSQKLYALYLLDSISKNIGLPYTSLFSHNLFKTFTQTYGLVDDQTRCKLIKLFKTWKVPTALTGLPLFDPNQLDKIEQFLIKVTAANNPGMNVNFNNNSNPSSASSTPIQNSFNIQPVNGIIQQPLLIKETDDLISLVNTRLQQIGQNDEKGQQRFKLLQQLKSILLGNLNIPQVQLVAVAKQLQSIREDELIKLNVLKQQEMKRQQQLLQQQQHQLQIQQQQPQQQLPLQQQQPNMFSANQLQSLLSLSADTNQPQSNPLHQILSQPTIQQTQTSTITNPLGLKSMAFLENILKSSSNGNSTSNQNNISTNVDFKFIKPTKDSILEDFKLEKTIINNHNPTATEISLLFEFKPNQCTQCSKRFSDSPEGIKEQGKHADWHKRVEQRRRSGGSGLGGVLNRSWYLKIDEWIEFNEEDSSDSENLQTNVAKTSVKLTKDIKNKDYRDRSESFDPKDAPKHIVRIPESSSNVVICGICREKIVGSFDEDSSDWIWSNATEQKGKVWHWTCWMEAKTRSKRERSPSRS
ncbi:hypothetical protein CANINC_001014 [Pichia inconspicua]|uniref:CID domain-containing protein n=1 Tax=Pichia inconspicua TaxID=52247 RepID=A0A4T0X566_9ASCO|nr:hypothetical protein CANINC_001014 [[Candida] inconspicua]